MDGGEEIIHLRFQKWYQPDLDRHLFDVSRKLERKYGKEPTLLVFLLWPLAEGPGTTGRFNEVDATGTVKSVFSYMIKRAWEMTAEEVMQSPGTMILAPLTKGARERMPDIVQMVKMGLDRHQVDDRTREMIWDCFYWSMGLACELDEAHRALGDMLPVILSSRNYLTAKAQAFMSSYSTAQTEGPLASARVLVLRQATRRFGERPGAADALGSFTTLVELETLAQRVLTAADWVSLIGA